jgi:hypothetical protein
MERLDNTDTAREPGADIVDDRHREQLAETTTQEIQ